MKVLFWLNTFLPEPGGIQTLCGDLVPTLMQRGHQVRLLTAHTMDALPDHTSHGEIDVWRVDSLAALIKRDPRAILRSKKRITNIIDDFAPDLIHIHPCGPEVVYYRQYVRHTPVPTVLTLHNNLSTVDIEIQHTTSFGAAFKLAQQITTVSDDSREWLLSAAPELKSKTTTVHNGIPERTAARTVIPWDPPILLFAGRFEAQKRVDVLLEAFATVAARHETVRLRLAGGGSKLSEMKALAGRLGIAHRVDFLEQLKIDEVHEELERSSALVLSSDYEGLPMVVLEAARAGRPVVSTDVGGVREAVIDGSTGLLVEPGEPKALAKALEQLIENPSLGSRFGEAAGRLVAEHFSIDSCADSYERVYSKALVADVARDRCP